jgi:hypothetical protein
MKSFLPQVYSVTPSHEDKVDRRNDRNLRGIDQISYAILKR